MKLRKFARYATAAMLLIPAARAQEQTAAARPQFEVASLKPNKGCRYEGGGIFPSPGRLEMQCASLQDFIQTAYGHFANGKTYNAQPLKTEGEPGWAQSESYSLVAKAEGPAPLPVLAGPMLKAFLEERFRLKAHWETRQMPVYALTVGKSGLKMPPLAEGACIAVDLDHPRPPSALPSLCGTTIMRGRPDGTTMEVRGVTITQFAQILSQQVDRPVIDRTGIAGMYTFHLEYAPDTAAHRIGGGDASPAPPEASDAAPTLLSALQEQTGLKVSSEKGPVQILVIDHVEKPSEN